MADVRWAKVGRDLRLHWGRSLLVVLAIATGLGGAGAILVKYALVRQATTTDFLASNPPAARLFLDRVTPEVVARVGALDGVRQVETRRTLTGSIWIDGKRDATVIVAVDDPAELEIGRLSITDGRWPRDGEVTIERSSLRRTPVETGTEIGLSVSASRPVTFPVTGIVHDVGVAPAWMEQQIYVYTTTATLASLGVPAGADELRLTVDDRALDREAIRALAERAAGAAGDLGLQVRRIEVPPPGEHVHAGQMNSLFFVQAALGGLALLFSGTLVFNLMTAILAGQIREIGIMKAVGARTGQIAGLSLAMVAVLGALAAVLAVPAAAFAGRRYAALTLLALNFEPSEVGIPLWALLLPALAGVALALLAAAVPVVRGARRTVAEAIRDHGVDERRAHDGLVERLLGRLGLPRPLLLSLRNSLRRRGRLALTLLTLTVGGALFMGAMNLRSSIRRSVDGWFAGTENDLVIRLVTPTPRHELEEYLAKIPFVAAAEIVGDGGAVALTSDGGSSARFALLARSTDTAFVEPRLKEGRWLRPIATSDDGDPPGELVVTPALQRRVLRAEVGDEVRLRTATGESRWRVVGILDASPLAAVAYCSWGDRARLVGGADLAGSAIVRIEPDDAMLLNHLEVVRAQDGSVEPSFVEKLHGMAPDPGSGLDDPATVRAEAPRLFEVVFEGSGRPVASVQSMASARQGLVDHMVLVVDLLWIMSLLVIAVGGFGLATTMSLAVLERTREIGILRAIGASHAAIRRLVVIEAIAIAAASWLLAVPLALPTSFALGTVFGRIMFDLPIGFGAAPAAAGVWLVVILALGFAATLWPAVRATRLTPREALARE